MSAMGQLRITAPKVVRVDVAGADLLSIPTHQCSDGFFIQPAIAKFIPPRHCAKHPTLRRPAQPVAGREPSVNRSPGPRWHWNCTNAFTFTHDVHEAPSAVALLYPIDRKHR